MTTIPPRIRLTVALIETVLGAAGAVWEIRRRIRNNHRRD